MKALCIDHVVIAVKDLDEAVGFFSKLFDTTFEHLEGGEEEMGAKSVRSPERIELISPVNPESPIAKFIESKGQGVYAIAFRVEDVDQASKDAKANGARVIGKMEKEQLGTTDLNFKQILLHPKDTFGVHILLAQYESAAERE